MQRFIIVAFAAAALLFAGPSAAWAGNPHFVGASAIVSDGTLTVSGKIAGLGNEPEVEVQISATAECVNNGGKNPNASNKTSVFAEGVFTVQNGKAVFSLTTTASFQPNCSPPMTVEFSDITVTDLTSGISKNL
ncbi:hypothetical protein L0U85_15715 [Glycomyces sp. L485]|uniref:hypothetical protein n=1 Tax=Glycomyces sp. L485 TaxID=2909235 RepID=UPI001F4B069F|nr:hypothetical protein [Glycomyces sp. L485]MCH7232291.1 hypothetical protein [Glycomyces sp. L485]